MIIQGKDKNGKLNYIDLDFGSFWMAWIKAYLATIGVIVGAAFIIGILVGAFS